MDLIEKMRASTLSNQEDVIEQWTRVYCQPFGTFKETVLRYPVF